MNDDEPADLTVLRDEITAALAAAGIKSIAYLPDRLEPPLALVEPGTPYVEPAESAGYARARWKVRHQVVVLVPPGDKRLQTVTLDRLVENALGAIYQWGVEQVGQPYVLTVREGEFYLAARIQLLTTR